MAKSLIGDKRVYGQLISLALPIMIQNGITNFVNMLDNIMIGAVGTAPMTGVSIANQLFFVFNLCIFGAISGAGIFGAQFFGSGDYEGVRNSFRYKLIFCSLLTAAGIILMCVMGDQLLMFYMKGENGLTDAAATMSAASSYMKIMLVGIVPFALVQCYSGTLRESGQPTLPMAAGVAAVLVNLVFNYILIFGKFGAPALGVDGAAIATVLSRYVELAIVVIGTHTNKKRYGFMSGVYSTLRVPKALMGKFFVKSMPLLVNEALWASGMAFLSQCYSLRGLDAMAAVNISQTFWNVFSIAFMALGMAVGILMGQMLGANRLEEARSASFRMLGFSFAVTAVVGIVYFACASFIPNAFNTEPEIRLLASRLIRITAVLMPFEALCHSSYFILRSGGRMLITFIFDSCYMWCINALLAFVLSRFTDMGFVSLFTAVQICSCIKFVIGIILVKNGFWVRNIVADNA